VPGAALHRLPGVSAAVFPDGPERAVYNNGVLGRGRRRGCTVRETTRAMGMGLDEIRPPRPRLHLPAATLAEHLRLVGMPPGFLAGVEPGAFHVLVVPHRGEPAATAIALDFRGDRGIYNVGTVEPSRRQGLASALTALLVHDARARGCRTASLQSTAMAERLYAAVGFRDLGAILEHARDPEGA
jgi:GNAT superfamily N-acetyltransferase